MQWSKENSERSVFVNSPHTSEEKYIFVLSFETVLVRVGVIKGYGSVVYFMSLSRGFAKHNLWIYYSISIYISNFRNCFDYIGIIYLLFFCGSISGEKYLSTILCLYRLWLSWKVALEWIKSQRHKIDKVAINFVIVVNEGWNWFTLFLVSLIKMTKLLFIVLPYDLNSWMLNFLKVPSNK